MPEENIRTYTFNVPGYIPGIPGMWSAGSWVAVNEDTKEILDFGPKLQDPAPTEQPAPETPPAVGNQPIQADPAQQLSEAVANL